MKQHALTALALIVVACGDDGGMTVMADARVIDATANKVVPITCPGGTVPTVMTNDATFSYDPMATTIAVNGIVKFVTTLDHNVTPNTITTTDPGLTVGFNTMKCLQFTAVGTYGFACGPHGFVGTVTVQ